MDKLFVCAAVLCATFAFTLLRSGTVDAVIDYSLPPPLGTPKLCTNADKTQFACPMQNGNCQGVQNDPLGRVVCKCFPKYKGKCCSTLCAIAGTCPTKLDDIDDCKNAGYIY
jgi:hypothetical protein